MTQPRNETSPKGRWQFSLRTLLLVMFAAATFAALARFLSQQPGLHPAALYCYSLLAAGKVFVLLFGLFASLKRIREARAVFRLTALGCGLALTAIALSLAADVLVLPVVGRDPGQMWWLGVIGVPIALTGLVLQAAAGVALVGAVFRSTVPASEPWLPRTLHPLVWCYWLACSQAGRAALRHFRLPVPPTRNGLPAAGRATADGATARSQRRQLTSRLFFAARASPETGALLLVLLVSGVYGLIVSAEWVVQWMNRLLIPAASLPSAENVREACVFAIALITAWKCRAVSTQSFRLAVVALILLLCAPVADYVLRLATLRSPAFIEHWFWSLVIVPSLLHLAGLALLLAAIHRGRFNQGPAETPDTSCENLPADQNQGWTDAHGRPA